MGLKSYFKEQLRWRMFGLEHDDATAFYLSCWQRSRSALPLLAFRVLLLLLALVIFISSMTLTDPSELSYWPIYMTNWGVVMIVVTTGLAVVVSARFYFSGDLDSSLGLPWYVKGFWAMYATNVPIAFLITVFYWSFLSDVEHVDYAANLYLDVMIHGMNSAVMFLLLVSSRVPSRLVHLVYPLIFATVYNVFSVVFYAAGGQDAYGNSWIYPMVDWSNPGPALIVLLLTMLLFTVLHIFVVIVAETRDSITKCLRADDVDQVSQSDNKA